MEWRKNFAITRNQRQCRGIINHFFLSSSKGSVRSNRRSFVKHLLNRKFLFRKFVRRQSDCLAGDVRNTKESPADGIADLLEFFLLIDSSGKIENDFQKKLSNGLHVWKTFGHWVYSRKAWLNNVMLTDCQIQRVENNQIRANKLVDTSLVSFDRATAQLCHPPPPPPDGSCCQSTNLLRLPIEMKTSSWKARRDTRMHTNRESLTSASIKLLFKIEKAFKREERIAMLLSALEFIESLSHTSVLRNRRQISDRGDKIRTRRPLVCANGFSVRNRIRSRKLFAVEFF